MSVSAPQTLEVTSGGVTTPAGFRAAGVSGGIKAKPGLDLALLVSDRPATAAAVFTTNRAQAAPVLVSQEHLAATHGSARAIIVNSGCANACTGDAGLVAAREMAAATARPRRLPAGRSAGRIDRRHRRGAGHRRKSGPVCRSAMSALAHDQGSLAARAIMTTDPFPKEAAVRVSIGGRDAAIGGMAKGSGMIEPMMATMLGFVTTDAAVPQPLLDRALREVVDDTFNAITVDGDCSTNDCVMLLANGASGATVDERTYAAFVQGLRTVCLRLALEIVRGGEGATKLVTVTVTDAASRRRRASRRQGDRQLAAGQDGHPRRRSELGTPDRGGRPRRRRVRSVSCGSDDRRRRPVQEWAAARRGGGAGGNVPQVPGDRVTVGLGVGTASSTVWTCDLSAEYVRINAEYRT